MEVYGSGGNNNDSGDGGSGSTVMTEKVQSLAASIYAELEQMIERYDEAVVAQLMPLVVGVLESLDTAYKHNLDLEVEGELLKDDNEQLVTQYEREKQLRKSSEQKYLELEDSSEGTRSELSGKMESLESIVRMLELKSKNSGDHVTRLEEKEVEMRKEYSKLHERYTELFKTHMDYMERTKMLMGPDNRADNLTSSTKPRLGLYQGNRNTQESPHINIVTDNNPSSDGNISPGFMDLRSPRDHAHSLSTEMQGADTDTNLNKMWEDDELRKTRSATIAEIIATTPELIDEDTIPSPDNRESLDEMEECPDITASDNFFGMGKEIENLIMENNELLATKNALNVVKDDLIARVDELSGEQEILRGEVRSLNAVRKKLQEKLSEMEDEVKRLRDEVAEKKDKEGKNADDDNVPMAQRKRFTRVEMARVLMERNQYKERLMELQEAVRWTEMIRASKADLTASHDKNRNKSSLWKFFSGLVVGSSTPSTRATQSAHAILETDEPTLLPTDQAFLLPLSSLPSAMSNPPTTTSNPPTNTIIPSQATTTPHTSTTIGTVKHL